MDTNPKSKTPFRSDLDSLKATVDQCHTLHLGLGVFDVADVEHALSLIDALEANVREKERIMHAMMERAS